MWERSFSTGYGIRGRAFCVPRVEKLREFPNPIFFPCIIVMNNGTRVFLGSLGFVNLVLAWEGV